MTPVASKLAPTALLLACGAVLTWSLLRADAAWQFFAAETIADNMHKSGAFTRGGIEAAQARVNRALTRFPGNPDYLDLSGQLKERAAAQPGVVGAERRELLEGAAQDYRGALASRPLWPYSWVNLLSAKDKLGQPDSEFNLAMEQAVATGPWEPRVQRQLIRSGVRYWDELKTPQRQLVREKAADALRTQPREVFEIARFYGRPDLVCGADSGQPQIERWCQNVQ